MSDCEKWVKECTECQHKSRVTVYDRVPITAMPRANAVFSHWFVDCAGPIHPINKHAQYTYFIVMVDSNSRWPVAFPLRFLSAKHVCDAMLKLVQTGIAEGSIVQTMELISVQVLLANFLSDWEPVHDSLHQDIPMPLELLSVQ